jgi:hypothetical protein
MGEPTNGATGQTAADDGISKFFAMLDRMVQSADARAAERTQSPGLSITRDGGNVVIHATLPVEHAAAAIQAVSTAHMAVLGLQVVEGPRRRRGRGRKNLAADPAQTVIPGGAR